jgi:hypothetical protein
MRTLIAISALSLALAGCTASARRDMGQLQPMIEKGVVVESAAGQPEPAPAAPAAAAGTAAAAAPAKPAKAGKPAKEGKAAPLPANLGGDAANRRYYDPPK